MHSNSRFRCPAVCLLALALIVGTWLWFRPEPPTEHLLANGGKGWFDLMAHWERGDVVALIRHAERCDRSDDPCWRGPDGITTDGRAKAEQMGAVLRRSLTMNRAAAFHSPLARTRETAEVMFVGGSQERRWLREDCKEKLLERILRNKREGENLILVTHATCISPLGEAQGQRLLNLDLYNAHSYLITVFLALDTKTDQAHVLGYLYPDEWGRVSER